MYWGLCAFSIIVILILLIIIESNQNSRSYNIIEPFIFLNNDNETTVLTSKLINTLDKKEKPVDIKYQIPLPANYLSSAELHSNDTNILRNARVLKNFSITDELDVYQVYSILKQMRNESYTIEHINDSNDSNDSNDTLEHYVFSRVKLELISSFNQLVIKFKLYNTYHPYKFFKIINSHLISNIEPNIEPNINYIFTITIAREYKYQQFTLYYDISLIHDKNTPNNNKSYKLLINKIELVGIPIPDTIEFKDTSNSIDTEIYHDSEYGEQVIEVSQSNIYVLPDDDKSVRNQSPYIKYIDILERNDIDKTTFDTDTISTNISDKIMNIAKDKKYSSHMCFGLVNGNSSQLSSYNNPIFCKSFHPEINQNGIWDAPCQINTDCPFYKANKNYPNEFGKCDKISGKCEMPLGIVPIGFTKYGKLEPDCYNCENSLNDNKCCNTQNESILNGNVSYKSPDYIFRDDETDRKQFEEDLKSIGLFVNPSI